MIPFESKNYDPTQQVYLRPFVKIGNQGQIPLCTATLGNIIVTLNSSFREDQNRPKDNRIWLRRSMILNLCFSHVKLTRSASPICRLNKPKSHVSSIPPTSIYRGSLNIISIIYLMSLLYEIATDDPQQRQNGFDVIFCGLCSFKRRPRHFGLSYIYYGPCLFYFSYQDISYKQPHQLR